MVIEKKKLQPLHSVPLEILASILLKKGVYFSVINLIIL